MKKALLALAATNLFTSAVAHANDSTAAVQAILTACTSSASSGAPVDTTGLMKFFEWDRSKEDLLSLKPLPKMKLVISNNFEIRCWLMAGSDIVTTDFAPAVAKAVMAWPGLVREDTPGSFPSFIHPGDAKKGLHKMMIVNEVEGGMWRLQVWDAGLPQ